MSIDEALKILGLSSNFTEEDLKMAYKKLIRKYHPDIYENSSEAEKKFAIEKAKQINLARDVLERMELLKKLKTIYKYELDSELEYIYKIDSKDKIVAKWKEQFKRNFLVFYAYISTCASAESLNLAYERYKEERFELLNGYASDVFCSNKIMDFVNGSDNFKIEKTDNLKSVRNSIDIIINEMLLSITDEFESYECYKQAERLLIGIKDGFRTLLLWGYIDIETAKKDFKKRILSELIKYIKREQKLDELFKFYDIPYPWMIELEHNILNEEKFNNIYNEFVSPRDRIKMKIKSVFSR